MSTIKLTDHITGETATCSTDDIEPTLRAWYVGAPAKVHTIINEFAAQVRRGEPTDETATALAITWERA